MPATQTFPASPRQIRFINALRQERGLAELDELTASQLTGGRNGSASRVITELQARPVAQNPAVVAHLSGALNIPRPRNQTRAGRMLNGGGIDATVTLPSGDHVTILISTRVPRGRGWANGTPGDEGARTNVKVLGSRVGWINVVDGAWRLSLRTRNANVRDALLALFQYAAEGTVPLNTRVQEASRCGRCRRTLTDPVSIDRGIGPECWGRCTGSHHAEVRSGASDSSVLMAERDRVHDAEFARREREQEEAGFASDPDFRRSTAALNLAADALTTSTAAATVATDRLARALDHGDRTFARDLIAAALKAYVEDELGTQAQADAALAIFDRLARVQS